MSGLTDAYPIEHTHHWRPPCAWRSGGRRRVLVPCPVSRPECKRCRRDFAISIKSGQEPEEALTSFGLIYVYGHVYNMT